MLHRTWDTGEEIFYLEKNVNVIGSDKWPSLQQFNAEEPHAIFEYDEEQKCFWLRDLSADSGIKVNGIPLSKTQSARLKNGDKISFGYSPDYTFTFSPHHHNTSQYAGRHNGYHVETNMHNLPKLTRGRAQSPRTLPQTAVIVDHEIPYPKRSPSPKMLTNAYRRRMFRAGSFDAKDPFSHHSTKPKVLVNAWGNEKLHYGSVSSPSHSGSWDGMIEKQSPRSRGAFVNTQQSQMIREMHNKIGHLESLLQEKSTSKHARQNHDVVDDANKTVELAQQILELRLQLNKKDDEIKSLKEKVENNHENSAIKNEIHRLKSALANSEKIRARLESDEENTVHTLVHGSHGRLKFHGRKFSGSDEEAGILETARSVDSISTINHNLEDSIFKFNLSHSKSFADDSFSEGKHRLDHKVQLKLYESKIMDLEKKLQETLQGIDTTEKHFLKNTIDAIDYQKNLSTLEEEKQLILKEKETSDLKLSVAIFLNNAILHNMINNLKQLVSNDEHKNYETFFKEDKENFIKEFKIVHNHIDDDQIETVFETVSKQIQPLATESSECFMDFVGELSHEKRILDVKFQVLKQLLETIKNDMEQKFDKLKNDPGSVKEENLYPIPDKINEYSTAISQSASMENIPVGEQAEIIDWAHGQVMNLYRMANTICPLVLENFQAVEDDQRRHEAFELYLQNLNSTLTGNSGSDDDLMQEVLNGLSTSPELRNHWINKEFSKLITLLREKLHHIQKTKAVDMDQNTDLSVEHVNEFQVKIAYYEKNKEVYENKLSDMEKELQSTKDNLEKVQSHYQSILSQREEYAKLATDQAQSYIRTLEDQIKDLEEKNRNETENKPANDETEKMDELRKEKEMLEAEIKNINEMLSNEREAKRNIEIKLEKSETKLQDLPINEVTSADVNVRGDNDELRDLKRQLQLLENGGTSNGILVNQMEEKNLYENEILKLKMEINEKDKKIKQFESNNLNKQKTNETIDTLEPDQQNGVRRNSFFDGPFQDVADHILSSSHSSLLNSFRRSNEHRTDDTVENDMFWNLSQRLAFMLDMDIKRQDLTGRSQDAKIDDIQLTDQMQTVHEITDRVEQLMQRVRQQNEELVTAREPKSASKLKKEEFVTSPPSDSRGKAFDGMFRGSETAKADKRRKQELPMKVVTFKLPDK